MSNAPEPPLSDTGDKPSSPDDTAAFQAYYRGQPEAARGVLYRVFIGWWRDRG